MTDDGTTDDGMSDDAPATPDPALEGAGLSATGTTADQMSAGAPGPGTTYGDPGGTGTADEESAVSQEKDPDAGEDAEGAPA